MDSARLFIMRLIFPVFTTSGPVGEKELGFEVSPGSTAQVDLIGLWFFLPQGKAIIIYGGNTV